MHDTILTQKLLTVLLAALMACPSWALRDCCCTRGVRRAEAASCCSVPKKVETKQRVSSCCAARMKSASCATTIVKSKANPQQSNCRPVSSCRCHQATTVATLTKPILIESFGKGDRMTVAKPPVWTVEARMAASRMLPSMDGAGAGLDGPAGRCVRLCRWLT